jgi:hypothetical protein
MFLVALISNWRFEFNIYHVIRPLGPKPLAEMMRPKRHLNVPDTTSVSNSSNAAIPSTLSRDYLSTVLARLRDSSGMHNPITCSEARSCSSDTGGSNFPCHFHPLFLNIMPILRSAKFTQDMTSHARFSSSSTRLSPSFALFLFSI